MTTTTEAPPRDELLTSAELAEWLKLPLRTPQNWRRDRKGPEFLRLGKRVRYRRSDVLDWLSDQQARR